MQLPALHGLLAIAAVASAARLTVSIPPSPPGLPNPAALPPSTHAVLVGPPGVKLDTPLRRDSSFVFQDLPEASYLLTIHARDHSFPPLRVDVGAAGEDEAQQSIGAWQTFRGNEWANKGPQYGSAKGELNIHVRPAAHKDFYQQRGGFNILGFLKSPMILMALVSVVMIFGMPYLMDNSKPVFVGPRTPSLCQWERRDADWCAVDPETKAEFEEMQKNSPLSGSQGAASQVQNFDLAGFLSGRGGGTDASAAGGSGKKR